jgi:hypothetical protein
MPWCLHLLLLQQELTFASTLLLWLGGAVLQLSVLLS